MGCGVEWGWLGRGGVVWSGVGVERRGRTARRKDGEREGEKGKGRKSLGVLDHVTDDDHFHEWLHALQREPFIRVLSPNRPAHFGVQFRLLGMRSAQPSPADTLLGHCLTWHQKHVRAQAQTSHAHGWR